MERSSFLMVFCSQSYSIKCYNLLQGDQIDIMYLINTLFTVSLLPTLELQSLIESALKTNSEIFTEGSKRTIPKSQVTKIFYQILEFDLLNQQIMHRYHQRKQLKVYTPIDTQPFTLVSSHASQRKYDWYTDNPCRVASQIVTGVEMMQILIMLEQIRVLKLKWIPVSLHHDGCALLVEQESFEESKEKLINAVKPRLIGSHMQIKGLEFSPYTREVVLESDDSLPKDNRIV